MNKIYLTDLTETQWNTIVHLLARIIKPGKTVAVLNIPQWAMRHFKCLNEILDFQDWIIWEGLSVPVRIIMPAHYSVICFTKGKPESLPNYNPNHSILETYSLTTQQEFYCIRSSCIKNRQRNRLDFFIAIKKSRRLHNIYIELFEEM